MTIKIYCGPDMPHIPLTKNQTYTYKGKSLPEEVKKAVSECESVKYLLVKPEDLANTLKKIKEKGSLENIMYSRVEDHLRGEKDV